MPLGFFKLKMTVSKLYVSVVIILLPLLLPFTCKVFPPVKKEYEDWAENFSFALQVMPLKKNLRIIKTPKGLKSLKGAKTKPEITIRFLNLSSAVAVFTGRMTVTEAVCAHHISSEGIISLSMSLIRVFDTLLSTLFWRNTHVFKL